MTLNTTSWHKRHSIIVEYDEVEPVGVLHLNMLSLGYPLTPEYAAQIRRLDPRLFPCFGVYAVENGAVAGQVLIYRLPVMTSEGPEDVGGVAAVCTHPAFSGRGIATRLMEAAHERMRAAGLRISTLGTARHRLAHLFYQHLGYSDELAFGSALTQLESARASSSLRVERAGTNSLALADELFERLAVGRLGFASRHKPFFPAIFQTGDLRAEDLWLLKNGNQLVGYAVASILGSILVVKDFLLEHSFEPADAATAIACAVGAKFVQFRINPPNREDSFLQAGYQIARPAWGTFMIKKLTPDLTTAQARSLLGIGTEQFLISYLDIT